MTIPSAAVLYVFRHRILVGAILTTVVAAGLLWLVYRLEQRSKTKDGAVPENEEAKHVVISIGQQGGQTAHTIINTPPAPKVALGRKLAENDIDTNGQYHTRTELIVDSPYPAANLYLAAHGQSVESVELMPQHGGLVTTGHAGRREGFAFNNLQSPQGLIHVDVVSAQPEPKIKLEYEVT